MILSSLLLPLTFRFFIIFLVENSINCSFTQERDMLTSNLTSSPYFWPPVFFRIWQKPGNFLSLCLAKRCYRSSKISLKRTQTTKLLATITTLPLPPQICENFMHMLLKVASKICID